MKKCTALLSVFFTLVLFGLAGCQPSPSNTMLEMHGKTMGTTYNIKLFLGETAITQGDLQAKVDAALIAVNQSMSTYIPDSEINQFNALAANIQMPISQDFRIVVEESIRIGQSAKTLDVTMGPLIDLWGFGPDKRPAHRPSDEQLSQMIAKIGVDKLTLTTDGLSKSVDGLRLSFSAIAKGYGIDRVAQLIEQHGITNYMVEIGGELRVSGRKADNEPWRIAIEQPDAPAGQRQVHRVLEPGNNGIATSGDYRIFYEMDGEIYTHLIDPQTGMPIKHDLVSVTVLHPSAMTADGLATALTVMGMERAKEYAEINQLPVYLMSKTPSGIETWSSSAFKPYL
ncbi:Thiamin biosynthesis lipoprotein ApbE [Pseudoalteromonas luteoviolacea B = ATCC 29581]|nr:Thiamin biosynthesis lipoprotein ApbE [Pseudoalteromonas luteoviolacea B = ATCC 29581]